MNHHRHPHHASETAGRLAPLGRELLQIARTLRYRCQLADVPLAADFELTYRGEQGSVTVRGEQIAIETGGHGA